MTTKGNGLQLLPSTIVQLSDFFSLLKKNTPCVRVSSILPAEVNKLCGMALYFGNGEWGSCDGNAWAICVSSPFSRQLVFQVRRPLLGQPLPWFPAAAPPRLHPLHGLHRGRSCLRENLESGMWYVLRPWLAQKLVVRLTNRSQNALAQAVSASGLSFGLLVPLALRGGL